MVMLWLSSACAECCQLASILRGMARAALWHHGLGKTCWEVAAPGTGELEVGQALGREIGGLFTGARLHVI